MRVNLRSLGESTGSEDAKLTESFLKLPIDQLVRLLVKEIEAKNKAYNFIFKERLMSDFLNFKEEPD